MKICFFGIYDPSYSRHSVLLRGLRQNGVEVVECREDWRDKKRYLKLLRQLRTLDNSYDFIYAAYPSSLPAIIARLFSKRPVIIDAFYSNFDSVVNDRKKYSRYGLRSLKLLIFDWLGVIVSDLVIADTEAHKRYWQSWLGMKNKKIGVVYIGADDEAFRPSKPVVKDYISVLFHGTFIPLQGVDKIVKAARICSEDASIKFRFIGSGRTLPVAVSLAEKYDLKNLEFTGTKKLSELNSYLTEADIVLGIFGDTAKAGRVVPNKVFEGLQASRSVITMDSPAIREIFTDRELLIVHNDPESIAKGIQSLAGNRELRDRLAMNGYESMKSRFSPKSIGKMFMDIVSRTL